MKRSISLIVLAACCAGVLPLPTSAQPAGNRLPNILFVMVDDMGWKDAEVYGSTFYLTPSVNRLAAEGIRFTNASTANPLCSPTRASILSGQYPGRLRFTAASGHLHGDKLEATVPASAGPQYKATVPGSVNRLKLEVHTLAEEMKKAGYRTGFVGKWHLGTPPYIPENQGFDFVVGGREHPGPPPPGHFFAPWNLDTLPDAAPGEHISDVTTTAAIEFIKANPGKPFFLCHWFYDVHAPFQSKKDLKEKYQTRLQPTHTQRSPTMGGMMEVMDQNLGRLLDTLENEGIADNTIVIFTSDNGGNMYDTVDNTTPTNNAPLRSGKGNNYEGGVRVPLIVRWPEKFAGGKVTDAMVSSVDFYPTLLDLIDRPLLPEDHIDGVSFVPALEGKPHQRPPILSHFPHYVPATDNLVNTSVRKGDWKLYRFWWDSPQQEHRYELYHLSEDIGETMNLADQHPDIRAELDAIIDRYVQEADFLAPARNPRYGKESTAGWNEEGTGTVHLSGGFLHLNSTGNDPHITTTQLPSVQGPLTVRVRMKGDAPGPAQLFWQSEGTRAYHEGASITRPFQNDGAWQVLDFPVADTRNLKGLRLDPVRGKGAVQLEWIRLVKDSNTVHEWTFENMPETGNLQEGWKQGGTATLRMNQGHLEVNSKGKDPYFSIRLTPPLPGPVTVSFRMSSHSEGEGQIFWSSLPGQPFHRDRSKPVAITHDGSPHEYRVSIPGEIHGLRLDPSRGMGMIRVDWIRIMNEQGDNVRSWEF